MKLAGRIYSKINSFCCFIRYYTYNIIKRWHGLLYAPSHRLACYFCSFLVVHVLNGSTNTSVDASQFLWYNKICAVSLLQSEFFCWSRGLLRLGLFWVLFLCCK